MKTVLHIAVFASTALLLGCATPVKPLDAVKWSVPLKSDGMEVRLYQTNTFQTSNPGGILGVVGAAALGETKTPASRPIAAKVLAADLLREGSLEQYVPGPMGDPDVAPYDDYAKFPALSRNKRRFILRVAVKTEMLNHLPMAWTTNQYWLGAQADVIDTHSRETIWESSCWISLDPSDKTRQITNDELSGPDAEKKFRAVLSSAATQCARAMFKAAPFAA